MCDVLSLHLLTGCLHCLRVSFDHAKCVRLMQEKERERDRERRGRGIEKLRG